MKRVFAAILMTVLCLGGTVLAVCPSADLSGDCFVDLKDISLLANQWLSTYGQIELSTMASQWLTEGIPDPAGMVWVSINDSGAGMKDGNGNPIRHGGFTGYMSKYLTTNAQYCQYLNAAETANQITVYNIAVYPKSDTNHSQPYYNLYASGSTYNGATNGGAARIHYTGSSFAVDAGFENYPVTYVSWYGATAFCNYYGYRLPTEWEWQAVADYDGSYAYGCGTTINNSMANCLNSTHPNGTTVVGAFGTYGYGMCDMAGNVSEWTSSLWDPGYNYRITRGGCWLYYDIFCSVSDRTSYSGPDSMAGILGFRVCR